MESWTKLETSRRASPGGYNTEPVTIGKEKRYKKALPQIKVRISKSVMESIRWVIGDRIDVYINANGNAIRMVRSPMGRVKLSPATCMGKGYAAKALGKCLSARVKFACSVSLADAVGEIHPAKYAITEMGLEVALRDER